MRRFNQAIDALAQGASYYKVLAVVAGSVSTLVAIDLLDIFGPASGPARTWVFALLLAAGLAGLRWRVPMWQLVLGVGIGIWVVAITPLVRPNVVKYCLAVLVGSVGACWRPLSRGWRILASEDKMLWGVAAASILLQLGIASRHPNLWSVLGLTCAAALSLAALYQDLAAPSLPTVIAVTCWVAGWPLQVLGPYLHCLVGAILLGLWLSRRTAWSRHTVFVVASGGVACFVASWLVGDGYDGPLTIFALGVLACVQGYVLAPDPQAGTVER